MAYQEQVEKLAGFVEEKTSYTKEEIEENIVSDWYITAEEGLEKGVYQGIISDISELLS